MPAKTRQGRIRIGISGWRYPPWRGVFYPEDLTQKKELEYASRRFSSIEINGTFYSLQRPEYFADWAATVPEDFVFSVKGPRFITHIKRLKDPTAPLANFFASGVLKLGGKLGPILWQVPPSLKFDSDVLEAFLKQLPHDTDAAVKLAKKHDSRMKSRRWLKTDARRVVRHALEIRHESFRNPQFVALLRKYNVALVCADTVEWPRLMDVTGDFIYARLHGSEELYASGYDGRSLNQWARRIADWTGGGEAQGDHASGAKAKKRAVRDVFVYFDNDIKVRAPFDALSLSARLAKMGFKVG